MSDIVDLTQEKEEVLAVFRPRRPNGPPATGVCLWCGEPLPPEHRWCNADCRDDWARHQTLTGLAHGKA